MTLLLATRLCYQLLSVGHQNAQKKYNKRAERRETRRDQKRKENKERRHQIALILMQSSIAIQLGGQCVGLSPKPRGSTSSSSMARWVLGPVYSLPSSVYHLQCPIFNLQSSAPSCGAGDCHLIAGPKQRLQKEEVGLEWVVK